MAVPTGIAVLSLTGLALWYDFSSWKSSGTGGTPPTFRGFLKVRRWGLYLFFQQENLLDASPIPDDGPTYLDTESIPQRGGQRPKLTRWTLPQRQLREPITSKASEILFDLMSFFANTTPYSTYLNTGPSKTEGGTGPAIYVNSDVPTINSNAHKIFYEVAHVHPADHSLHVYLSPRDARLVIEKGWGQRFPISWLAPSSWIMVYAPRDEKEVKVIRKIVRGAVCFAVGKELNDE